MPFSPLPCCTHGTFTALLLSPPGITYARALACFEHYAPDIKFYSRPSYAGYARTDWHPKRVSGFRAKAGYYETDWLLGVLRGVSGLTLHGFEILLLNQAFYPDSVSTGQHLSELAVALAERGHQVTVITGRRAYDDPEIISPDRETWRGIQIFRVYSAPIWQSSQMATLRRISPALYCLVVPD